MSKTTQGQYACRVSGIPGNWNNKSGGAMDRAHSTSWNGGSPDYDILAGPATYSNITLTRPKKHEDEEWLRRVRNKNNIERRTITQQELDEDYGTVGPPVTYPGCLLVGVQEVEPQAGSADEATIQLTFATKGPAR